MSDRPSDDPPDESGRGKGAEQTGPEDPESEKLGTRKRAAEAPTIRIGAPEAEARKLDPRGSLPSRYRFVALLGGGGMGQVVRALDTALQREVAVKVLDRELLANPALRERFVREARTVAAMRHPGIVQVHDVDLERGVLVMELLPAGSLSDLLRREGPLPEGRAIDLVRPVLQGIAAAHEAGIVHRDVKPSNILLDESGTAKLCDFGVAHTGDSSLTVEGSQPGTVAYMAPEQLRGRSTDARSDVYSAGATIYEMLTGRQLHAEPDRARRDVAAALVASGVGEGVAAAVAKAVSENPSDRFQDALALLGALEGRRPALGTRRRRWLAVGAIVLVAGIGGVVGATLVGGEEALPLPAPTKSEEVAFFPFRNRTGDDELDFAEHGVPRALGRSLATLTRGEVVGYDALRDVLGGGRLPDATWQKAARESGARYAVTGDLRPESSGVGLDVRMRPLDPRRSREGTLELSLRGPRIDLDRLVRLAARHLAEQAFPGTRLDAGPASPPRSLETLRHLHIGLDAARRADFAVAASNLESTVALAPDLEEAWHALAIVRSWHGTGLAQQREAIERAMSGATNRHERDLLRAMRLSTVEQRPQEAIPILEELRKARPRDRDVLYTLGEAYLHGGNVRAGVEAFRTTLEVAPAFLPATIHVIRVSRATRNGPGTRMCLSLVRRFGSATDADRDELLATFAARRYDEALARAASKTFRGKSWVGVLVRAAVHLVRGEDDDARHILEESRVQEPTCKWGSETVLAAIAYRTGDLATARRWSEEAARVAAQSPTSDFRGLARSTIGIVRAMADDTEGAMADLAAVDAEQYPPRVPRSVLVLRGLAARVLGRPELLEGPLAADDRDVRLLAEGLRAEMEGDRARAAALLSSALDEPTEGYFDLVILQALVRNRLAIGHRAGVEVACERVERPAVYHPYRELALVECRRMGVTSNAPSRMAAGAR